MVLGIASDRSGLSRRARFSLFSCSGSPRESASPLAGDAQHTAGITSRHRFQRVEVSSTCCSVHGAEPALAELGSARCGRRLPDAGRGADLAASGV